MAPTSSTGLRWPVGSPCGPTFHPWSVPVFRRLDLPLLTGFAESPRYLCWIGRHDAAREVIERLHRDPNDPTNAAAHAEFLQIRAQVEHDKEQKSGYIRMFTKPSWRRRSLLVLFIMFASQSTGVNGIANYLVVIFGTLNLHGVMPLVVYGIYAIIGTIAAFIACKSLPNSERSATGVSTHVTLTTAGGLPTYTDSSSDETLGFTMDKFGRRQLFLIGFPALAINLLIEALLQRKYLGTDSRGGNIACVAFIFLFIILFQFIDAPSFVWSAEIFPTTIRAKGVGLAMFGYFVGFITFSTPGPVAFRNM